MIPVPVRLYNAKGPDRVAVVSTEPASRGVLVRVARGPRARMLSQGHVFGPYSDEAEVAARFQEVVEAFRLDGFGPTGLFSMLEALNDVHPAARARAAIRLGWRRSVEAVEPLLDALSRGVDDVCPMIDALGEIGDPRAIPAVREYANRKLLSRRRSAVEALRNLGDVEGVSEAIGRARGILPESVRNVLESVAAEGDSGAGASSLADSVRGQEEKYQGLALDTLYEIGTPVATGAVRLVLAELSFGRPYHWRYIKSIHKRAMLRHDFITFGQLSHAIEIRARSTAGTKAKLKSGYDGVERETPVFQHKTQDYLRRLGWRYVRNLAAYRPHAYPHAAAEALVPYTPEDAEEPSGLRGEFARCYLLHRILFGESDRFRLEDRRLVYFFRDSKSTRPAEAVREEAFPNLWDAEPMAYLRVLGAARLPEAQIFAYRAIAGPHRRVLEQAATEIVFRLLYAPYEPTVRLGLDELERRFNPVRPDLALIDQLLSEDLPRAKDLGRRWLRQTAPLWTRDQEWVLVYLGCPDSETASLAAELASPALGEGPEMRQALAGRLLDLLRQPESSPGAHDVYARVAREALSVEMGALLSLSDLIAMVTEGTPPVQTLGGDLLGRRPDAIDHLGLEGLAALAEHEVASVRKAAHDLMRRDAERFRSDPAPLLLLVESRWDDTRQLAFEILRDRIGLERLGSDGLMGLLDSNRTDVQDVGRELAKRHMAELDPRVLMRQACGASASEHAAVRPRPGCGTPAGRGRRHCLGWNLSPDGHARPPA